MKIRKSITALFLAALILTGCGGELSDKFDESEVRAAAEEIVELADRLDKGLVDVGLLLEPVDTVKYDFVRLSQKETWGILMRRDHPLAERTSIEPQELISYPLILPLRERVRTEIMNWLR